MSVQQQLMIKEAMNFGESGRDVWENWREGKRKEKCSN